MSKIKESALELIGNTPILKLNQYSKRREITEATVLAKLEAAEEKIQKLTDASIKKTDDLLAAKQKELMEI